MAVQPVNGHVPSVSAAPSGADRNAGAAFERLLGELLGEVRQAEQAADRMVEQFALGQADSVHSVMLAVAQAEMAFRMVMEIRDRLIQAYNDVIRMQV